MLFNVAFFCSAALAVSASNEWRAPTASDRMPKPLSHGDGYLPRDDLNISLDDLIVAFTDAINLDPAATTLVGKKALTTGNNGTFNLDDLNKHGGQYRSIDCEDTIPIATAVKARKECLKAAAAVSPEFSLPADLAHFNFIETALYLSVFGDFKDGNAKTEWVKTLFRKLTCPVE
ncbi:chloroperoxidase [Fusarium mundagurra]|uniref:Chloroperoxidase n=1 Tax=Fusarium mundagurra TaxID=1567541 RepID=A0A8H6D4Z2_9HYPO|nr:chloroperoxidase [Fusarium mundagurra]